MSANFIWGMVAMAAVILASSSFDQWVRRRYPIEQSVFKKGDVELRVSDSEDLLPLVKSCGMVPENGTVSASQTTPEAKT